MVSPRRCLVGVHKGRVVALLAADLLTPNEVAADVAEWVAQGYDVHTVRGQVPGFGDPWPESEDLNAAMRSAPEGECADGAGEGRG